MSMIKPVAALLALVTLPAVAAADDVAALRAEFQAMQSEYEARVRQLEARIRILESAHVSATDTSIAMPAREAASLPQAGGDAAFNPSISVVLGGSYAHARRDADDWHIAGFAPAGEEIGPGARGFDLGESELTLAASVDPYFSARLTAAITADSEIEVEEAYVRTSALPRGFTARLGRFFSGLGYLNEVHAHAWDFADQPLVYQAMFGGQYRQDGLQLKWLAPTDFFLEFGAEAGNGDAFPGTRAAGNGFGGATLFAHAGADVGYDASWRVGASWQSTRAGQRDLFADARFAGFTGDTRTWIADAVFKWAPAPRREVKLQAEYLHRDENGLSNFEESTTPVIYDNIQRGWYLQGVYQFATRWRAGLRYDRLDSGDPRWRPRATTAADVVTLPAQQPERLSAMLDWNPSEFTRLRAQYDFDDARDDGSRDGVFRLQYLFGIGAHGAHKY